MKTVEMMEDNLADNVVKQIVSDVNFGDVSAIEELIIRFTELKTTEADEVVKLLKGFLPEEEHGNIHSSSTSSMEVE